MRKIWHLWFTVLAVVTLAACGQAPTNSSAAQEFTVVAKEFAYTPAALNVTVGQPVTIILQNTGTIDHDFSIKDIEISGEAKASGETQGGHMMGGMGDQPKLHVAASVGGKATLTFTPSK